MVAVGALPARLLGEVAAGVSRSLGVALRRAPALGPPAYAFNEARRQYHSPAILRRLAPLRSGARGAVLGLVDGDLFVPDDGEFVLGDADRAAGAALVGLGRLGQQPDVLGRRALAEALRALGHVVGLPGCPDRRCAMYPSHDAADVDRKEPAYCASCRAALGGP